MPLFLSDEEYARCSHDPSLISQKANAFITQLYNQLETQKAQLDASSITAEQTCSLLEQKNIDKDAEIQRLSNEVSELQKSKIQLLELIEHKDLEINEKISSIKGYLDKIVASTDPDSSKAQISEEVSAKTRFEPEVIQVVQNMVQFNGLPDEDPYGHITNFLEITNFFEFCGTFKITGASNDAIRLRLFPFSLRDKAKLWHRSLPVGSITTWDTMCQKFCLKYFPRSKTGKLTKEIYSFVQDDEESLYESWERFKDLLRRCPPHKIPLWSQVHIFWNGLFNETRRELDRAARGSLLSKTAEDAYELIERMAMADYRWQPVKDKSSTQGIYEVDAITSLTAKVEALTHKMDQMLVSCELPSRDCQHGYMFASYEQVDYMGNEIHPQNNPYNNTYNSGQRNHPNSSNINDLPIGFQQYPRCQQEEQHQKQHQYY